MYESSIFFFYLTGGWILATITARARRSNDKSSPEVRGVCHVLTSVETKCNTNIARTLSHPDPF